MSVDFDIRDFNTGQFDNDLTFFKFYFTDEFSFAKYPTVMRLCLFVQKGLLVI